MITQRTRELVALTVLFAVLSVGLATAQTNTTGKRSGYVALNGLNYYYEIHGTGEPVLLLHGGLGHIGMFGDLLPAFAKERQVIAVDLHGHGRTALGNRHINLSDMGDDMAALVKELGYKQVDVVGYSFGGGLALRFAIQHPAAVRRLVVASAPYGQEGFFPELLPMQAAVGAAMADQMKETPMYKSYVAVAPRPEEFPRLLDEMGAWMRTPYNWSEEVKTLSMPVMLVFGDADMVRPEHIVEFYHLLGGGLKDAGWQREHMSRNRLAILPDLTHYEVFLSPRLVETVLPFINGESWSKTWIDQLESVKKK
jgi:pimeloyl-ACP methyl ester carboxylesterase